jgi:hypothetical protein
MKQFTLLLIACISSCLAVTGCSEDTPLQPTGTDSSALLKTVTVRFTPRFDGVPLTYGTRYVDAAGDTIRFSTIRFYISEAALIDTNGASHPMSGLSLVDFGEPTNSDGSVDVSFKGMPGFYRGVTFSIGVPIEENHRDAATQGLPLGPNSGMYWSWNPGYIFHKIEGAVDSAGASIPFVYHIGDDNRRVTVRLASLSGATRTSFTVDTTGPNVFNVSADYAKLFSVGVDPSAPMYLKMMPSERFHHLGPKDLADRTARNTEAIFTAEN